MTERLRRVTLLYPRALAIARRLVIKFHSRAGLDLPAALTLAGVRVESLSSGTVFIFAYALAGLVVECEAIATGFFVGALTLADFLVEKLVSWAGVGFWALALAGFGVYDLSWWAPPFQTHTFAVPTVQDLERWTVSVSWTLTDARVFVKDGFIWTTGYHWTPAFALLGIKLFSQWTDGV